MEKGKLPECKEIANGGGGPDCPCPACAVRRAFARLAERPRAAAATPVIDFRPPTPASTPKIPSDVAAAIREEETLRANVDAYLLKDVRAADWDTVIGNMEARTALMEAIEAPVKHADLYTFYGRKPPRGILLHGAPGCGKTMLGRAAASALSKVYEKETAQAWMLKVNGPEIQTPYVGATEKIIRDIFAYARAFRKRYGFPLVIFVDEADSILPARSGNGRPAQGWEQSQVAAFLTEMDGLEDTGALVILATNRPDSIDEAVLRDGRVDLKIEVERPSRDDCVQILSNSLQGVPLNNYVEHTLKGHAGTSPTQEATLSRYAERTVDYMLSPVHVLETLQSDVGPLQLTLRHIVSGALVTGLGEQARGFAFRRDLSSGTRTGLQESDLTSAVDRLFTQNAALTHHEALWTLCEKSGAKIARRGPPEDESELVFNNKPAPAKAPLN